MEGGRAENIKKIYEIMNQQYSQIKHNIGIGDVLYSSESDEENTKALRKLRPDSKLRFKDFIHKKIFQRYDYRSGPHHCTPCPR